MLNEQRLFKTVCINDPAIDADAMSGGRGIIEWTFDRDLTKMQFIDGERPRTFYLRTLPASLAHSYVSQAQTENDMAYRCFRACVMRVDNPPPDLSSSAWEPARVRDKQPTLNKTAELLSLTEMDAFDLLTIYEIGAVAHRLAFFPSGTAPSFSAPHISAQIWDAIHDSRRAAQAPSTAENGTTE